MRKSISLLAVFLLFLSSWTVWAQAKPQGQNLFSLLNQRLALMQMVAAYKYQHNLPIKDAAQEKRVLQQAEEGAARYQLNSKAVKNFMQTQISIASVVEYQWILYWRAYGFPGHLKAKDLTTIRSQLTRLDSQILQQIAIAAPLLRQSQAARALQQQLQTQVNAPFVTRAMRKELWHALLKFSP